MQHTVIHKTLGNKISLLLIPLANTEAVTTIVLMGVGSRYERDDQQGLAHFTEHMVFKGGRTFKSSQEITQALDGVGGEFNAFTSQEYTGFYTKTAAMHLPLGLQVLSDMVLHATIPEQELEKEKGVIVEEINMYEDMPMRKVDMVLSSLVYGDTPLGRPISGTKKTVTAFTREDFLNYREQFYKGAQCTVVIAGSLDVEEATKMVEEYFAELPAGEAYKPVKGIFQKVDSRVLLDTRQSEQTHLMLAVKGYELDHPKRYAYRLLSIILGGNMSSRLFTSVREQQGLCYYVRATPDTYVDTGVLVAGAGVDNNRLKQAVQAIIREFQKIKDHPVTEEELERAKQFSLGKLLLGLEDSEQVAEFYGSQYLLERKMESLPDVQDQIKQVTIKDIQEVAQEIFQEENLRLAVVGPYKDTESLEELLMLS